MALILPGYPGTIWNSVRASLVWASANMKSSAPAPTTKAQATAVAATLKNAINAIDASQFYSGLEQLYANLAQLTPLPLQLASTDKALVSNRISAVQAAAISLKPLLVFPGATTILLNSSQPAVPDIGYLPWLMAFSFETVADGSNIATTAQAEATAWSNVANALRTQGIAFTGTLYNSVVLMANASQVVATAVSNSSLSSSASLDQYWNLLVAMPTIARCASAIMNDPTNASLQQVAVARYIILSTLNSFNRLITALRDVVAPQLRLGTLRVGENLMNFANRELGNFEAWRSIAQLNGLQPPYVGKAAAPGIATPGQQLFLPSVTSAPTAPQSQLGPVASYINNYLGIDKFLGQIGVPMLPWTGDYQLISGYQNLAFSLGRRLQTTVGTLIYHPVYGSRIPPEIGSIASQALTGQIRAYTISALQSDPRVNRVLSCTVQLLGNYSVEVSATVLPNGLGREDLSINEVIGPA